mmetsp:Transcript_28574/g.46480  ORF Transcript_28574/g.46480 Transcript_28574/m.46480 type:complete len:103 (+) Transcript_28574:1716-2024(+)
MFPRLYKPDITSFVRSDNVVPLLEIVVANEGSEGASSKSPPFTIALDKPPANANQQGPRENVGPRAGLVLQETVKRKRKFRALKICTSPFRCTTNATDFAQA